MEMRDGAGTVGRRSPWISFRVTGATKCLRAACGNDRGVRDGNR